MKELNQRNIDAKRGAEYNYSDTVYAYIVGGAAQTVTVPATANFVAFSGSTPFYVNFNGTATVPGSNITDGTSSVLNPTFRYMNNSKTFSIIAAAAGVVTLEFFA